MKATITTLWERKFLRFHVCTRIPFGTTNTQDFNFCFLEKKQMSLRNAVRYFRFPLYTLRKYTQLSLFKNVNSK